MNNIVIAGRLTKDVELKAANTGTEYCNFTVAVDRRRKDQNGEKVTDFFDCTAWGKTAVFVNQYFHRGDGINLAGRMESNKWKDQNGNNRVSWGISVDLVEFPLGKASGSASSGPVEQETNFDNPPF